MKNKTWFGKAASLSLALLLVILCMPITVHAQNYAYTKDFGDYTISSDVDLEDDSNVLLDNYDRNISFLVPGDYYVTMKEGVIGSAQQKMIVASDDVTLTLDNIDSSSLIYVNGNKFAGHDPVNLILIGDNKFEGSGYDALLLIQWASVIISGPGSLECKSGDNPGIRLDGATLTLESGTVTATGETASHWDFGAAGICLLADSTVIVEDGTLSAFGGDQQRVWRRRRLLQEAGAAGFPRCQRIRRRRH